MPRYLRHLTGTAALLLAAAAHAGIGVGDPFPSLGSAGLAGSLPDVSGRVVLVDFWASWCAPCKASFPAYARLHTDFASADFAVIAISVDQDEAAYRAFLRKTTPPFAVARDTDQQLARQVDVPAMPTCFLIGRDGRVHFMHRGFQGPETETEIRREITRLLAEKPASS